MNKITNKIIKWTLRILAVILAVTVILITLIELFVGKSLPESEKYLKSDRLVTYSDDNWLLFKPNGKAVKTGLAFYPGGPVDAEAYARLGSYLAHNGILAVIIPANLRIAMFSKDAAGDVIEAFPYIDKWFIGGHSVGGAAAAFFVRDRNDLSKIAGLVLVGSYLKDKYKITNITLPVLSIYGSNELSAPIYEPTKFNISPNTTLKRIEGGNHSQFGYYGFHFIRNTRADISRDEQQSITEKLVLNFIREVTKK